MHLGWGENMIPVKTMGPFENVFTHVDREGGNIHIAVDRVIKWAENAGLEKVYAPIETEMAIKYIDENSVSLNWVNSMLASVLKDPESITRIPPIIYAQHGNDGPNGEPSHFLLDGHHRYVMFAKVHLHCIGAYLLSQEQWRPFEISGMDDISRSDLVAAPVIKIVGR